MQQVFLNHDTDLLNVTLRTISKPTQHATTSPAVDPTYKQRMAAVASHGSHAPPASTSATTDPATTPPTSATTTQPGDEMIHTTANHPWLSADRGWVVAGQLELGEPVQRADGSVAVVALTTVRGSAPMWDLTVSNVHDFAVGDGASGEKAVNVGAVGWFCVSKNHLAVALAISASDKSVLPRGLPQLRSSSICALPSAICACCSASPC